MTPSRGMPLGLLLQLSWRNIWRHRRRNAILLSAIAIAVTGVMLLNTMMRGMQQDLMNTAIENLTGHVKILEPGYLDDPGIERGFDVVDGWQNALPDHVRGWAERIRVPAVLTSERETRGIQLVGVDPARESISFLGDAEVSGEQLAGPRIPGCLSADCSPKRSTPPPDDAWYWLPRARMGEPGKPDSASRASTGPRSPAWKRPSCSPASTPFNGCWVRTRSPRSPFGSTVTSTKLPPSAVLAEKLRQPGRHELAPT